MIPFALIRALKSRYALLWMMLLNTDCAVALDPSVGSQPATPASNWPLLLGAQYTVVDQSQSRLRSPYSGPLSLVADGDIEATNTFGIYSGWAPWSWSQLYLDVEKFDGAGVSSATGLAGLTNGDVLREGTAGIKKEFYIARLFGRLMLPLTDATISTERAQDQIPGTEAATRLELKIGRMAVTDDFDQNRYAGVARTQFLNWSLWANTAFDYAANTRGYTNGVVIGFVSPLWSLKYGFYLMPLRANGQQLEYEIARARSQNLELRISPTATGTVLRFLAYVNTARMGNYHEALTTAAANHMQPDIQADEREGRHKRGFGVNVEQPLADNGDTGLFLRWGWNDGRTESFAFTEVDREVSFGGQLSGIHWGRAADRLALAVASNGLSGPHREYSAAGGCGFLLCDGRLNYRNEQILETYYRIEEIFPRQPWPIRWQLGPDYQDIRNPGYNHDRGPVHFWAIRFHVEY
jgi:high affinity Mn2+ porin